MLSWKPHKDVSEIWSFLGMARYYKRFIVGFSKLAKPMTTLLERMPNLYGLSNVRIVLRS